MQRRSVARSGPRTSRSSAGADNWYQARISYCEMRAWHQLSCLTLLLTIDKKFFDGAGGASEEGLGEGWVANAAVYEHLQCVGIQRDAGDALANLCSQVHEGHGHGQEVSSAADAEGGAQAGVE